MSDTLLDAYLSGSSREFSLEESEGYCSRLARTHYENFSVVTILFPKDIRQDAYNVYAYCRWADDLGDELRDRKRAMESLRWWREQLDRCYRGEAKHPVFVALRKTIERHELPKDPFAHLLYAFEMDQSRTRWDTFQDLLAYCRYSANPVGRLILLLFGYTDEERMRLSDATCTGLQLANFWQDVKRDFAKGRIYLPQEDMKRFGVTEEDLKGAAAAENFRKLLEFQVGRTRPFLERGLGLVSRIEGKARIDIELFSRGGMVVLDLIEKQNFDVLARRPVVSKPRKAMLFFSTVFRQWLRS